MEKITFTAEPGKQEIVITRVIDAPPERVFRAMMDPALIPRWWGPRKYETIVDSMEVRAGGTWRFINRDADGTDCTRFTVCTTPSKGRNASCKPLNGRACRGTSHSRR